MGTDYDVGWAGFTYYPKDETSEAIAYGERWERSSRTGRNFPKVSHAFLCSGVNEGIEAHLETGVARFSLSKYTADPGCQIYFRQPLGWTRDLGRRIASSMAQNPPFGCAYDMNLICADVICDTFAGHYADKLTRGQFKRLLCWWLGNPGRFICSEAVAFALQKQKELRYLGCLRNPADTIDPQQLFEDRSAFARWYRDFRQQKLVPIK